MMRTYRIRCKLEPAVANALNLESGRIYTRVLVEHWWIMRQTKHWLSPFGDERYNDFLDVDRPRLLHSHSIDAAQQGFAKASKTAKAAKKLKPKARHPHWPKKFRTTIWKNTAIHGDEQEATIILCPECRHEVQGLNKRMASLKSALSRKVKGSRRYKKLVCAQLV